MRKFAYQQACLLALVLLPVLCQRALSAGASRCLAQRTSQLLGNAKITNFVSSKAGEWSILNTRPQAVFCDFDGTITQIDGTDAVLERFALPEWRDWESLWRLVEI